MSEKSVSVSSIQLVNRLIGYVGRGVLVSAGHLGGVTMHGERFSGFTKADSK